MCTIFFFLPVPYLSPMSTFMCGFSAGFQAYWEHFGEWNLTIRWQSTSWDLVLFTQTWTDQSAQLHKWQTTRVTWAETVVSEENFGVILTCPTCPCWCMLIFENSFIRNNKVHVLFASDTLSCLHNKGVFHGQDILPVCMREELLQEHSGLHV